MSILEIFEKVNLILPIEQRRFFNYFEDTVYELQSMYSGFVLGDDTDFEPPTALDDENMVLPLYHSAIVDNIVFLAGSEEVHKNEFLRKANNAYLKYWNDNAKCRKMKRIEW